MGKLYTDASQTGERIGLAIHCGSRLRLSTSDHVSNTQVVSNNTQAETIALAIAVTAHASDLPETHIYSDSKAAIQTVTNDLKPCRDVAVIEAVSLAREVLSENRTRIFIHHVYSHTTDTQNSEQNRKRAEANQASFGKKNPKYSGW